MREEVNQRQFEVSERFSGGWDGTNSDRECFKQQRLMGKSKAFRGEALMLRQFILWSKIDVFALAGR